MKKRMLKIVVLALMAAFVLSFASTSFAYSGWPNPTWNQTIFGVVKRGDRTGAAMLAQWNCYAAQAKNSKAQIMKLEHVDGIIGPRSVEYIKSYQLKKGLTADGKVGNSTWRKMQSYVSSNSDPRTGKVVYSTHDAIRVYRTSMHKSNGRWYTWNRNVVNVRIA